MSTTARSAKYFHRVLALSYSWGSVPYFWNSKLKRVEYNSSPSRKAVWFIHNFVYNAYLLFVAFRWYSHIQAGGNWMSPSIMGTLYVFVSYSVFSAIQYGIWSHYGRHQLWINGILQFRTDFQDQHTRIEGAKACKDDGEGWLTSVKTFIVSAMVMFILDSLSVIMAPEEPYFVTSLLHEPKSQGIGVSLLLLGFHMYIWVHQHSTGYFFVTFILAHNCNVQYILRCIGRESAREGTRKSGSQGYMRGNPALFPLQYTRLQILQGFNNHLWGHSTIWQGVGCIIGSILAYFGAVEYTGARAAQQAIVGLILTVMVVYPWDKMGDVNEVSTQILATWRLHDSNPWFKRYLVSARPIRANIGGFFYADRGIKLTIMAIILDNTMNLLLSSRN